MTNVAGYTCFWPLLIEDIFDDRTPPFHFHWRRATAFCWIIRRKSGKQNVLIAVVADEGVSKTMAASERVEDSAFRYDFRRVECLAGYSRDESNHTALFGHLLINTSSVACKGFGVEATPGTTGGTRIISSLNASLFSREVKKGDGGWTFETWASFANFDDCPSCAMRHMASIRSSADEFTPDVVLSAFCSITPSSILFLQQNYEDSVLMERASTGLALCGRVPAVGLIDRGIPIHVVYTEGAAAISSDDFVPKWYFNGVLTHVGPPQMGTVWEEGYHLQLLNDAVVVTPSTTYKSPSEGSVYLLAMYTRPLTANEVLQNFEAGLANSPPVAEDIAVTIFEDGESEGHYNNPEFYLRKPTVAAVDLPIIHLLVYDLDQQEGFPGFNSGEEPMLPDVRIESIPLDGALFDVDGFMISDVPHTVEYNNGYSVKYRPEKDEFSGSQSVYTSFTYSAYDVVTGEASVVPGLVSVRVLPRNDPPIPHNQSITVSAGTTRIFLSGSDVDSSDGDAIRGILLVDNPLHGELHEVSQTCSDQCSSRHIGRLPSVASTSEFASIRYSPLSRCNSWCITRFNSYIIVPGSSTAIILLPGCRPRYTSTRPALKCA